MDSDAWNSHSWSSARGRRVEVEPDNSLVHHHCSRCLRDFLQDLQSGERYAVHVSALTFRRFPDPIAKQWIGELCPGTPLPFDAEVRSQLNKNHVKKLRLRTDTGQSP